MTLTKPKSDESRELQLKLLGETLKGLTPKQLENAVRMAGSLLRIKANRPKG